MSEDEIRKIVENNGFEKHAIDKMIETNNKISESITTDIELNQALFPKDRKSVV